MNTLETTTGAAIAAPVPSLRERAEGAAADAEAAAERERLKDQAERAEKRRGLVTRALREYLEVEPDLLLPTGNALVQGIEFGAWQRAWSVDYGSSPTELYVVGTCPRCGGSATSEPVYSLAALAPLLETFRPRYGHECELPEDQEPATPAPAPVPPLDEQLADALRAVIRQEIRQHAEEGGCRG